MPEEQAARAETPKTLYKFTTIDTARRILESARLRYSSPLLFNDPFDSQWDPMWPLRTAKWVNYRTDLYAKYLDNPSLLPKECEAEFRSALLRESDRFKQMNEAEAKMARDVHIRQIETQVCHHPDTARTLISRVGRLRICCFSKSPLPIQMWSHYGDQHKGVVLAFDSNGLPNLKGSQLAKVDYSDDLPEVIDAQAISHAVVSGLPLPEPEKDRLKAIVFMKATPWHAEDEWRHVYMVPEGQLGLYAEHEYQPEALVSIIAGVRTSHHDFIQLAAMARGVNSKVAIREMHRADCAFALSMVDSGV